MVSLKVGYTSSERAIFTDKECCQLMICELLPDYMLLDFLWCSDLITLLFIKNFLLEPAYCRQLLDL